MVVLATALTLLLTLTRWQVSSEHERPQQSLDAGVDLATMHEELDTHHKCLRTTNSQRPVRARAYQPVPRV